LTTYFTKVHIAKNRFLNYLHFKQVGKKVTEIIWNLKIIAK
jgi:hypothetical protein